MEVTTLEEAEERVKFARRAAKCFAQDSKMFTFTDKEIEPGCLFAVRFGLGDDCVMVFRLDEECPVVNFQQIIRRYQSEEKE